MRRKLRAKRSRERYALRMTVEPVFGVNGAEKLGHWGGGIVDHRVFHQVEAQGGYGGER